MRCCSFLLSVLLISGMFAAENIGTVNGTGPLVLRGDRVPASAARGLPVASGDEIRTSDHEAVILLKNHSRVVVYKNSTVKLVRNGDRIQVGVAQGAIRFSVAPAAKVSICADSRLIIPSSPSKGTVSIVSDDKVEASAAEGTVTVDHNTPCNVDGAAARWLTKNKAIVIVVAAAAGGTAAGVAAARGGPPPAPAGPVLPSVSER